MSADLPDWSPQAAESWKVTLPCTRAEGEALAELAPEVEGIDPSLVLLTSEPDPARPDDWQLDAYLESEPDAATLAAIRALVPSAASLAPSIERVADADWVALSQAWLEPIRAGRFFVHTAAHADAVPPDAVPFRIEAGRAFGTGHHETTTGCLELLDRLADGAVQFANVIDIGTGTGLLAFAARALWPDARITASDIDPVAITVAAENMAANAIPPDAVALVAADGLDDPRLAAGAPYDLIIANILAGPLIALAPAIAAAAAPGATVVLAGLLSSQAPDVLGAFRAMGMAPADRLDRGDWSILAVQAR